MVDEVERIRYHPLIPKSIPIYGSIYDDKTGELIEIEKMTKVGAVAN